MNTPPTTAAMRAATIEPVMDPTTAEVKAAVRNWPSMETFTTPARSHSTPQRAPRINGVASVRVPCSWFDTGNGRSRPEAAQVMKPIANADPAIVPAKAGSRPTNRPERKPAAARTHSNPQTNTTGSPGTLTVGSCTSSRALDRANLASPFVEVNRPSSNNPTTMMSVPTESRWVRFSADSRWPAELLPGAAPTGRSSLSLSLLWTAAELLMTTSLRWWPA